MEYNFKEIEKKWQKFWVDNKTYKVDVDTSKPKFYVLDMFPYPSGAGLHVGHPLGYIASDIYSRYKRLKGFNVLHPMGYDAYGLPAEQYAIQTGQHPAITTDVNIKRYRQQLDKIGFSYDWDREIRTSDPEYYKWTQWAFIEMFKHYFNNKTQKAEAISDLVLEFQTKGNAKVDASTSQEDIFTAEEWNALSEKEQDGILLNYRLAYLANTMVNWCPQLGTVLANDEIKDGLSVRGGYPVEQKKMRQWSLRVSAYAKRLLEDMEKLEWTDSLKEIQRNWIGRSEGAEMDFVVKDSDVRMTVFTTRPDTIFGVSFMVLAPESELVDQLTTPEYKENIAAYIAATKKRTERERMADVKTVSGEFTGSYAIHPFSGEAIPVWVSDYVLAGYGTGAIMAVPAHDSRDYSFAKKFDLPIVPVVSGGDISEESYDAKSGEMINSDFMNGLDVKDAIVKANVEIEERELGKRKINFRLRDAIFSRQRYWGEPFPVYFKDGMPKMMDPDKLPLELPEVDKYLPTETGEPPLGRATNWTTEDGYPIELNTMPGFAGSSAYYLRYMDPRNNDALVSEEANEYWQDVDLYIGGTEHATGHLIYSRFWNKFLFDIGKVCKNEPFKKLINQGMIQGRSNFVYRVKSMSYPAGTNMPDIYVSKDMVDVAEKQPSLRTDEEEALYIYLSNEIELIRNKYNAHSINYESFSSLHVDVNIVKNDVLDTEAFKSWMPEFNNAEVILNSEGNYVCGWAVEKMSKSMFNVVNPDVIVEEYGADTLRLYEMFLGPLEASKPWDTNGIDGVHKFLKKLWRLFHNDKNEFVISTDEPTKAEYKILHKSIKKIQDDIERFSFNTSVSAFMICVNELNSAKCNKKAILEELLSLLAPFAPHITEELWKLCGNTNSITDAKFPVLNESYLVEDVYSYPVSFNGKMRFLLELSLSLSKDEIEQAVMTCEQAQKWIDGKTPKKVIIVPKKIVNIVV